MAVVFELLIFLIVGLVLLTLCGIALNTILEMAKKFLPKIKNVLFVGLIIGIGLLFFSLLNFSNENSTAFCFGAHTDNEVTLSFAALLLILGLFLVIFLLIFWKLSPLIDAYVKKLVDELKHKS